MKSKLIIILIFSALLSCKTVIPDNFSITELDLINGVWVAEDSDINNKWVFQKNNVLKKFSNGSIQRKFNFQLSKSSNSGVQSLYLELTSIDDTSDKYLYEISHIDDNKMIIVYQRPNNMGIAKPATYFKQ